MERVIDNSPKRIAMLITLAIWAADKDAEPGWSNNSFDYTAVRYGKDISQRTADTLLRALGPFAAATLPEVPFGCRYASEGRPNV